MKKSPLTVIITVLLFGMVFVHPAYANSARRHWQGTDGTGALTADKDCPIVVDKEILTFDVQEFPKNYYNSAEEFLAYTGKVTAEYTFRNPADYTVTATLVFPFGNLPHYGEYFYDSPTDKYTSASDTEKYGVTVDGKQIEAAVRHTLKDSGTPFSLDTDMSKLSDGYISDAFFSPELPVWMQQYSVEGVNADNTFKQLLSRFFLFLATDKVFEFHLGASCSSIFAFKSNSVERKFIVEYSGDCRSIVTVGTRNG